MELSELKIIDLKKSILEDNDADAEVLRGTLKDEKLENRRQAFLKEQRNFVTELMMALDKLLPNFEEEEGQEGIILRKKS